jgi:fatty-acid desaturase
MIMTTLINVFFFLVCITAGIPVFLLSCWAWRCLSSERWLNYLLFFVLLPAIAYFFGGGILFWLAGGFCFLIPPPFCFLSSSVT